MSKIFSFLTPQRHQTGGTEQMVYQDGKLIGRWFKVYEAAQDIEKNMFWVFYGNDEGHLIFLGVAASKMEAEQMLRNRQADCSRADQPDPLDLALLTKSS